MVSLRGLYAAKLYVAAPVLLALLIMAAFGEGDYIFTILTVLYTALAVHGERVRRAAPFRSFRRSLGFNIALLSSVFAVLCGIGVIAFAASGVWRYLG